MTIKKQDVVESFPRFERLPLPNILLLAESGQIAAPFDMEWFDCLVKPDSRVGEYVETTIMPSLPKQYKNIITLDNITAALKKLTPEKIEEIRKSAPF